MRFPQMNVIWHRFHGCRGQKAGGWRESGGHACVQSITEAARPQKAEGAGHLSLTASNDLYNGHLPYPPTTAFGTTNPSKTALGLYFVAHDLVCVCFHPVPLSQSKKKKKERPDRQARPDRRKPRCPSILSGPETIDGQKRPRILWRTTPQFARQRRRASEERHSTRPSHTQAYVIDAIAIRGEVTKRDLEFHSTTPCEREAR
jgi:hypothetical protein